MIVLMKLLEENSEFAVYSYGYDDDKLDGRIKLPLNDPNNYEILKESQDKRVGQMGIMKCMAKLIRFIKKNNKIPQNISYEC